MRRGLLIKDGSALERLADVNRVLFDKTGTLTVGEPRPIDVEALDMESRGIALALSQASRHPLSKGLAHALRKLGTEPAPVDDIREVAGEGMRGRLGTGEVGLLRSHREEAGLGVDLLRDGERRHIAFADPLRPDVGGTLAALSGMEVESAIVSGDREETVAAVARDLGLRGQGGMQPQDKLDMLARLSEQGDKVLMVGDGLNDGPALAGAHVSLAPGGASDVSQQAADAVFVDEELMPVALAIRVARHTMGIVRENFAFAAIYNLLAVPLAVLGHVTPLIAAIAMSGSSLIVVGNSLRLARAAK